MDEKREVENTSEHSDSAADERQREAQRTNSVDYDPSIWDFLSPATGEHDNFVDDDSKLDDEDDDDADDAEDKGVTGSHISQQVNVKHAQAVLEIVDTEISYGNDLVVLKRVRRPYIYTFSTGIS